MTDNRLQKAAAIIAQNSVFGAPEGTMPYCTLSLLDENGYPTTSALTAAKSNGISEITFCTGLQSNKAKRIGRSTRACVCFCADAYSITLVGDIEIVTDPTVKQAMWYDGLSHHFSGADDPGYCVLRFRTKRYGLFIDWEESGGTL